MTAQTSRPLRVLVADDHAPTRDDVRRSLERNSGFSVCAEAADAAEAVEAAVRERPDVCLLDLRMPGGGVAAAWEISARLPGTKIVMLTVSDDETDLLAALRARAVGYLVKTMSLERLPHALQGAVDGEAPIQRALVTRLLERFHDRTPRRRSLIGLEDLGEHLTSREWQVLGLLAHGYTTARVARELSLSSSAVRVHIAAIVRKLGVPDRESAVALFRRRSEI
ncbi:MAG TPA: response regulator transcription factor [Gaiellaceae bacterium]|nr:response regulator transcription factor [Gaiellaceae bacterium]